MIRSAAELLQVLAAVAGAGFLAVSAGVHITSSEERPRRPARPAPPAARPSRPAPPPAVDPASPPAPRGRTWTWSDEFDGTGPPAPGKWAIVTGDRGGWGGHGLVSYDAAHLGRDGRGHLVITADHQTADTTCWYGPCSYGSGRIRSVTPVRYGRVAARIRFPTGAGVFPAFWLQTNGSELRGPRYGEIDIGEIFGARPRQVFSAAHHLDRVASHSTTLPGRVDRGFHTYAVDWTPARITWTIDGRPYGHLDRYKGWPFDQPLTIIVNLQIGGAWQGSPPPSTRFPARMTIDWIRALGTR
ncbi:glycoside hydrolase family 16 protein [Actinocorallia longicatena]|uniref:GH16 domain-containing protein n=1 Tax=Actinocorallia longicatena TaxID=111803 RepID=A0ABP6QAF0_9ACTN